MPCTGVKETARKSSMISDSGRNGLMHWQRPAAHLDDKRQATELLKNDVYFERNVIAGLEPWPNRFARVTS